MALFLYGYKDSRDGFCSRKERMEQLKGGVNRSKYYVIFPKATVLFSSNPARQTTTVSVNSWDFSSENMSKIASQPANNSPRRSPGDGPPQGLMGGQKEAPKHTPQRPHVYAAQQQQRAATSMPPPQGKPVYSHPMAVHQPQRAYPASTSRSQPGAAQQQLPHLRETSRANMPAPREPGTTVPHKRETWKNEEGDKLEEQFEHLLVSRWLP